MNGVSRTLRRLGMTCAVPALLAVPVAADPAVGLGVSVAFGSGQVQTGIGIRVFSDNRRDSTVAAVGLDYMFGSQSWRGTVGAAYLGSDAYISLDLGIGLGSGEVDFGIGLGGLSTKDRPAPAAPPAPPPGDGGSGDYDLL